MKATYSLGFAGAVFAGALAFLCSTSGAFVVTGSSLPQAQRDFRVFNNFTDVAANDNQVPDANFPGYQGATMAIWKGTIEWGSRLHGDGEGDPIQPGDLGSGGANFDSSFQGAASGVGVLDGNVHSEINGGAGGVLAFAESGPNGGWRIRYFSTWTWHDGPGPTVGFTKDLQGVAAHEYGHALGLGHSSVAGATMATAPLGNGDALRSIEADDIAGVRAIYGIAAGAKPRIHSISLAGTGILTITGANFSSSGNQVWFTKKGPASNGDPVKVPGLTSPNGTTLQVLVPGPAGPGDILVRRNSSSHSGLSNAFPFDPTVLSVPCGSKLYGTGLGGTNTGTLQSLIAPKVGSSTAFTMGQLDFFAPAVMGFSPKSASLPFFGGTLLIEPVGPPDSYAIVPFITATTGNASLIISLPNSPSLAFLTIYCQAASLGTTGAWTLTNGLEFTICP